MITVIYLYKETLPDDTEPLRCWGCGWIIGRYNRGVLALVLAENAPPVRELPPGATMGSHVCHRCKKEFKVIFQ